MKDLLVKIGLIAFIILAVWIYLKASAHSKGSVLAGYGCLMALFVIAATLCLIVALGLYISIRFF